MQHVFRLRNSNPKFWKISRKNVQSLNLCLYFMRVLVGCMSWFVNVEARASEDRRRKMRWVSVTWSQ